MPPTLKGVKALPGPLRIGVKEVTVIRGEGTSDETRLTVEAQIQADSGYFPIDAPIYMGDIVELPDPRGGLMRNIVASVKIHDAGMGLDHIEVKWGASPPPRCAAVRRLGIEGLHPDVIAVASDLFTDEHYSQAVFEALKALDKRVSVQSGLDLTGRDLMTKAFGGDPPLIDIAHESGRSGDDEQEGFRFIFMGVTQGIRNPKGHELVEQDDPQRALEYLAIVSILFRRLDDAQR
jgi:uncharacterized protein (TIGR02391 family)